MKRARIEKLHADARALSGLLKEAESKRGGLKAAHAATRENVANILKAFAGIRGILRNVARTSPELANILETTEARK